MRLLLKHRKKIHQRANPANAVSGGCGQSILNIQMHKLAELVQQSLNKGFYSRSILHYIIISLLPIHDPTLLVGIVCNILQILTNLEQWQSHVALSSSHETK